MYDYLIVGAGITGCVFAHEMTKRGKKCLVIDKRNHIGGNCYSEEVNGIEVHKYGAHIFRTNDRKIYDYFESFGELVPFINSPLARYKDELYNLPFNMNTFHQMWGVKTPKEAKAVIDSQAKKYGRETVTLEEHALSMVGQDIYEKLIRGYTEKQWGRECSKLPKSIMTDIPVRYTFNNNYFNEKFQAVPKDGYELMFEKMLKNVSVILGYDFFKDRSIEKKAKKTLFTGMIDQYFGYCFGMLDYRSLRFEEIILDDDNFQGNAVVNYTERDVPYTRVIEHKHFVNQDVRGITVLTREYPDSYDIGKEPFYPIEDERNLALYKKYKEIAESYGDVIFGGRLGTYQYDTMDRAIQKALELVKREVAKDGE